MDKNTVVFNIEVTVEDIEQYFEEVLSVYEDVEINAQEFVSRVVQNSEQIDQELMEASNTIYSALDTFL